VVDGSYITPWNVATPRLNMGVNGASTAAGAVAIVANPSSHANQDWLRQDRTATQFNLKNRHSGLCGGRSLSVAGEPDSVPGGSAASGGRRLVLCDDWMTDKDRGLAARERCLDQFRAGWRIGSLYTVPELVAMSERAGLRLVEDLDLTSHLRLGRPRDRAIKLAVGATAAIPRLRNVG
jgi:hypothetical protein